MPIIQQTKTNFTAGEVSQRLLGRGDLRAYENGALSLRNVFIHPTGGITRRAGLHYVDAALGKGRLIDFEFNTEQTYLLVITPGYLRVYQNDAYIAGLYAPWTEAQIKQISWSQSADTVLITHPDVMPKKLVRTAGGVWQLVNWVFDAGTAGVIRQPYFKFAEQAVTLTPSATAGAITLTASSSVFLPQHVGTRFRVGKKEVIITSTPSSILAHATCIEALASATATRDWEEQAFSDARGWPVACVFHQDRLVIGGSRDLPNRLWFSQSGALYNFNLGTGEDDEAIEFAILSDQVNAIRAVFSSRHLQVFTSGAEWQVSGSPLTPRNVQVNRQTRVGSLVMRTVSPVDIDGATIFAARSGRELREFVYTDVEQAYQANDLALLAQHIIRDPVDQAFDKRNRLLHLVLADGKVATLTVYRAEAVAAWTLCETAGKFLSVAAVGDVTYVLVERGSAITIERYEETMAVDCGLNGTSTGGTATWSGLGHLEGRSVTVLADGNVHPNRTVTGGSITLNAPAKKVQIGLGFSHVIEPLPVSLATSAGTARALRLVEATFRLQATSSFTLDVGRGLQGITLTGTLPYTGDKRIRAFGWRYDLTTPLWRIESAVPLPFTLLSVITTFKTSD